LHGAKRNLREVAKSEVNLDRWIQKDTWRRSMYFRGKVLQKKEESSVEELPEG
jgi:hypothetical protein